MLLSAGISLLLHFNLTWPMCKIYFELYSPPPLPKSYEGTGDNLKVINADFYHGYNWPIV